MLEIGLVISIKRKVCRNHMKFCEMKICEKAPGKSTCLASFISLFNIKTTAVFDRFLNASCVKDDCLNDCLKDFEIL